MKNCKVGPLGPHNSNEGLNVGLNDKINRLILIYEYYNEHCVRILIQHQQIFQIQMKLKSMIQQ
jgi:hypothetical protein